MYGGKTQSFNINFYDFFLEKKGLSGKSKIFFIKRFELNYFVKKKKTFLYLNLNERKIINMYLSQLISINNSISELLRFNIIRLYLIKTYRGRCHALSKPVRGQRT